MDKLYLSNIEVATIIGVRDHERTHPQKVRIHLELFRDLRTPGSTDDLSDTIDYSALRSRIIDTARKGRSFLIEKLAAEIAEICLVEEHIEKVRVRVEKPQVYEGEVVGCEIVREKDPPG